MFGPAPIVDFDGTIAALAVDWAGLRASLGVARIDDLWSRSSTNDWDVVAEAEADAARRAAPYTAVVDELMRSDTFAVLTSNSERAVTEFLRDHPVLADRIAIVVGRESLRGPKTTFTVFADGFHRCADATASARGTGPIVYVGDQTYELDFARRLGASALAASKVGVGD